MGTSSKKEITGGVGLDHAQLGYVSELYQDIVSLEVNDFKMIPHPDGMGNSIVYRRESIITVITNRMVKDGFLRRGFKILQDVTEIKEDGVYHNGRKL